MTDDTAGICIIGGGPAGSTLAVRMARLGHDVCLVERAPFPRRRLGESLSPGVLPLLETIGARETVEAAGFNRVHSVRVKWDHDVEERRDPGPQGLLVDRGRFDQLLLERARAHGVRVLQPAMVRACRGDENGWSVRIDADGRVLNLHAGFLADASGRTAARRARRRRTGCRTLALYAYWCGRGLPEQPRIEAGADAWYWGVPLPDGTYNTLVFVDCGFRLPHPERRFLELIGRSSLMDGCRDARLAGPVLASDATPYVDEDCVGPLSIKVGDAGLAIDPLSSSGVQKAIQTSLSAAVVVNTMLRRPAARDDAARFYREHLVRASERHRGWAASHYATAAAGRSDPFWRDRASGASPLPPRAPDAIDEHSIATTIVELSPRLELVDLPCIEGEFVTVKPALRHPGLDGPLAYLGGFELAPLIRRLPAGLTPLQIARSWSDRMPLAPALAIASWLVGHRILVPHTAPPRAAD